MALAKGWEKIWYKCSSVLISLLSFSLLSFLLNTLSRMQSNHPWVGPPLTCVLCCPHLQEGAHVLSPWKSHITFSPKPLSYHSLTAQPVLVLILFSESQKWYETSVTYCSFFSIDQLHYDFSFSFCITFLNLYHTTVRTVSMCKLCFKHWIWYLISINIELMNC